MLDTLRVRAALPYNVWMSIEKQKSFGVISPGLLKLKDYLLIPPYDAIVTVSTQDFKYVYLEASLPKIVYGHNVKLIYPCDIPDILQIIEDEFIKKYGDICHWDKWEVQRIDPCYAWKFDSTDEAIRIIRFLRTLEYPMKNEHWYKDETITFGGRSFSITFYIKEPEFQKQYRKLLKSGFTNEAEEALTLSKGVLRYEIRMFKAKLSKIVGRQIIYCQDLFNVDLFYNALNACLTTMLHNSNRNSLSDHVALEKFKSLYKDRALRLFCFWKTYYLENKYMKGLLTEYSNATTIARTLKDISKAGVGIPNSSSLLPFDLSIPSVKAVTPQPKAPNALALEPIKGTQEMLNLIFEKEWRG
jgi:II/X family phage/plasmid replication protein